MPAASIINIGDIMDLEQALAKIEEQQKALEDAHKSNESMKSKMDELLTETKRAKEQRKASEEAARIEAEEKARANGDFEQLLKSTQEKLNERDKAYNDLTQKIAGEKVSNQALKIASELADGYNAELLSEQIAKRLKYTDDGVKVLNGNGELTISTLDELKTEFSNNDRFAALLRGTKATGGGANGGKGGASGANTVKRSDFDNMSQADRSKFFRDGGKVVNDN